MTSTQIQCFMSVAKHLNFSKAANDLFMAQSSLSKNISNLEIEMGLKLFVRTKKYVSLTPAGAVLHEEFKSLSEQYQNALKRAISVSLDSENSIKIGIVEAQKTEDFLPKTIALLKKEYSSIHIDFTRGTFKELRDLLISNEIDVAVTFEFDLNEFDRNEFESNSFMDLSGACVISSYHPLASKEALSITDLKDETVIAISSKVSRGGYERLIHEFEMHDLPPAKIQTADSVENIILLVESGMGVSILDRNCIVSDKPTIKLIPFKSNMKISLAAVWKKSSVNPIVPLFINALNRYNISQ